MFLIVRFEFSKTGNGHVKVGTFAATKWMLPKQTRQVHRNGALIETVSVFRSFDFREIDW